MLSKIIVCRTAILDGHLYKCPSCRHEVNVYNSCGDRHCPQCAGAKRLDWLDKASELILPGVHYFQVVFTLPDKLSGLILGNRRQLYALLFRSAWRALNKLLRQNGQFQPAALMVLHTWNQQLEHHPHIHAIVPGGGPSLDGSRWMTSRHPTHRRRKKPYLVDNVELSRLFRQIFVRALKQLARTGKLKLEGQWSMLQDPKQLTSWCKELCKTDWNVFVQGPPKGTSDPKEALMYLTRYMTGGPISDRRLVSQKNGKVTFMARSKDKRAGNPMEPMEVSGAEFVRRWSMHILPKGFTKARYYGGYHTSKREATIKLCRELLPPPPPPVEARSQDKEEQTEVAATPLKCPHCKTDMNSIVKQRRPSWQDVFNVRSYSRFITILPIKFGNSYKPDD